MAFVQSRDGVSEAYALYSTQETFMDRVSQLEYIIIS